MRTWMLAVVVVGWGCGDDGATASGSDTGTGSTGSGSSEGSSLTMSSTSVGESSTTADTTGTTTGEGSEGSSSTTGAPVDPFGEPQAIALELAFDPLALELGDFDGDGDVDLLIVGTDGGAVTAATLANDGTGAFAAPVDAGITACSAFGVVGDIDGDVASDLFFGTCGVDDVSWLGQPGGGFAPVDVLAPWMSAAIVASRFVDVEGDADDDLIMLTLQQGIELHVARSDGGVPWAVTASAVTVPGAPTFAPGRLRVGDLDGDAITDAVLIEDGGAVARVLGVDGDGVGDVTTLEPAITPWSAELADLDGDGRDDVVVSSRIDAAVQVFVNDGAGGFVGGGILDTADLAPFELVFGDFDGDAAVDLAIIDDDTAVLAYARGSGDGGVFEWTTRALGSAAVRLHAADLDGSGTTDLVAATFAAGTLEVLLAAP